MSGQEAGKKRVLEEDVFTDAMAEIIERDFFPSLAILKAQEEVLQAEQTGHQGWIEAAKSKLSQAKRQKTPRGFASPLSKKRRGMPRGGDETPLALHAETPTLSTIASTRGEEKEVDTSTLRLDAFTAKYTSEDNASFSQLVEDSNKEKRAKCPWLFDDPTKLITLPTQHVSRLQGPETSRNTILQKELALIQRSSLATDERENQLVLRHQPVPYFTSR